MRKLSDYRDEEALDLLADIIEPATKILADEEVREAYKTGNMLKVASVAIKRHKENVLEIMAAMEGVPRKEYHCNIFTLPARVLEITNDKELMTFFTSQVQEMVQSISSGHATENTEGKKE